MTCVLGRIKCQRPGFGILYLLPDTVAVAIVAACLLCTLSLSSRAVSLTAGLAMLGVFGSAHIAGRAIVSCLPHAVPPAGRFAAAFLTGFAGLSVTTMALCLLLTWPAGLAAAVACGIGVTASMLCRAGRRGEQAASSGLADSGAVAVICVLSVVWSWQAIGAYPALLASGVFPAWVDDFYHAALVVQFAHFHAVGGTWIFAHGARLPIYHYAVYMLPAVLSDASGLPALSIATAFTVPFSFIVMGLGCWLLGVVLAGRAGGAMALAALLLLPDASHYGFGNAVFGLHWILQVTWMGFAVGLSLLVVALSIMVARRQSVGGFLLCAALTLSVAAFKMQIFALLFLWTLGFAAVVWRPRRAWLRWACIVCVGAAGAAAICLCERLPRAPHFLASGWDPGRVLQGTLGTSAVPATVLSGPQVAAMAGLLLLSAFGVLVPAYGAGCLWCRRWNLWRVSDAVPGMFVVLYVLMVLTFPKNANDGYEFQRRPFTLVYAVLAIWCAGFTVRIADASAWRAARPLVFAAGLALLPVPFLLQGRVQSGAAPWMADASHVEVPRGLLLSAAYIRQHAGASDLVMQSGHDGDVPTLPVLSAMAERASYVLMLDSHHAWQLWGIPLDLVAARESVGRAMLGAKTYDELARFARGAGIGWYVLAAADPLPKAVTDRAVAAFAGYYVFDFSAPASH